MSCCALLAARRIAPLTAYTSYRTFRLCIPSTSLRTCSAREFLSSLLRPLRFDRVQHSFGKQRQILDPDFQRVVNRIAHGRSNADHGQFADTLGAERSLG